MIGGYLEDDDIVDRTDLRREQEPARDHRMLNPLGTLRAMFVVESTTAADRRRRELAVESGDVDEDYYLEPRDRSDP